jgi:hypothetical protein
MDIQTVKGIAESCLTMAQTLLIRDKVLTPIAISVRKDGKSFPTMLSISKEEDKDNLPDVLWQLSLTCDGLIVIIDSYMKSVEVPKGGTTLSTPPVNGSLKDDPAASQAIFCLAYVKGQTAVRPVVYQKATPDATPIFFDQGWIDTDEGAAMECHMANPFRN